MRTIYTRLRFCIILQNFICIQLVPAWMNWIEFASVFLHNDVNADIFDYVLPNILISLNWTDAKENHLINNYETKINDSSNPSNSNEIRLTPNLVFANGQYRVHIETPLYPNKFMLWIETRRHGMYPRDPGTCALSTDTPGMLMTKSCTHTLVHWQISSSNYAILRMHWTRWNGLVYQYLGSCTCISTFLTRAPNGLHTWLDDTYSINVLIYALLTQPWLLVLGDVATTFRSRKFKESCSYLEHSYIRLPHSYQREWPADVFLGESVDKNILFASRTRQQTRKQTPNLDLTDFVNIHG